jgi:hypothetical protein
MLVDWAVRFVRLVGWLISLGKHNRAASLKVLSKFSGSTARRSWAALCGEARYCEVIIVAFFVNKNSA